jgi:nucleoside-diphosphate-sugar epimerase
MHVLVAGCGWLGVAVARALLARGDRVTGIRRDPARAAALADLGVTPLALDLAAPGAAAALPRDVDAVVACQSASGDGAEAYRRAYVRANGALLGLAAAGGVRSFVYTGSTGLFGQRDGSDVDEDTPPAPASLTAEVLVEAEALVAAAAVGGIPARVVRLSGLYGPGRLGTLDRVRRGALALGPGDDAWMNFCHQDDAVTAVLAALDRGRAGAVYHASDAAPPRRREVVEWIAARLGVAPARAEGGAPGPNRRVLAERTRRELGIALAYPSFRDGFAEHLPQR